MFEASVVNRQPGGLQNSFGGFTEKSLDNGHGQAFLEFVGKGSGGQLQRFIQGMNAGGAIAAVSGAVNIDGTEDGFEGSPLHTAVSIDRGRGAFEDTMLDRHL